MEQPIYDLTITGLAYGGDSIARIHPDGGGPERVVFVPFAIPGERIRVRIVEERRGFARAELLDVLEPAPERVVPRCKHFGVCGGCHYQHMPYELQLHAKTDILRDQFRRIGHIEDPPVNAAVGCPEPWNYRNHVQFHLTRDGRLGYVAADRPLLDSAGPAESMANMHAGNADTDRRGEAPPILAISECHLPEPAINQLWPQLEFEHGIPLDRVSIRQGADEELLLVLESESPDIPELEMEAAASVVHLYAEHSVVLAGRDRVTMSVLGRDFQVSAPSFFQVNTVMAERMVQHIEGGLASSLDPQRSTVLDVYCGAGLFSAFLASRCRRLMGIESSPSACDDFAVNLDEFDNVELYEDTAEKALPALDVQPDVVLVDPPRAGLAPAALDAIVRLHPSVLCYISCDPSTLARDAARLIKGGYRMRSSTPFDLFPQTFHIESITWFDAPAA